MPIDTIVELPAMRLEKPPAPWFRREERAATIATILLFLGLLLVLTRPLFSTSSWMIFVQDDFLYYLKVAQNIAHGRGSTFNTLVPTNGYQPLWLMVLVVLSWFTENPRAILAFLAVSNIVSAFITFLLAGRLVRTSGVRPLLVFALAAFITIYSVSLFFYGMEVVLAVPLLLGVVCLLLNIDWLTRSSRHAFALGLLLSLLVLARIDTLIFCGLIAAGILSTPSLRRLLTLPLVTGVGLGLLPLPAYFALNHALFQTWLPVSGMAKQLRHSHLPSLEPWLVFFHPLAASYAVLMLAALSLLPAIRHKLSPMSRILFPAIIVFPFLYYLILSCLSDWTLWGWYMYPLRTAICISFVVFSVWAPSRRWLEQPLVTCGLVVFVFGSLAVLHWTRQQEDIYAASVEIKTFAATHPGTYAMGDRAGRVAYMIPNPVVQTEGLMMDRAYLRYVEQQTPLLKTLAHYNVHYYIATAYTPFSGCFHAGEPAKSGPTSAKMRADFCDPPAARYVHDGIETLIFDLQQPK